MYIISNIQMPCENTLDIDETDLRTVKILN